MARVMAAATAPVVELVNFHKALRGELDALWSDIQRSLPAPAASPTRTAATGTSSSSVREGLAPEQDADADADAALAALCRRYAFLHSAYQCHSASEDEVVFPMLEQHVHNVGHSYTHEHEVEERLFQELQQQLCSLRDREAGARHPESLRGLLATAEAVRDTLLRHLCKEEQQLFPLIEKHLSLDSQRELLWKFFSSIPLTLLEQILPWMLASLQPPEQQEMLRHLQEAVPAQDLYNTLTAIIARHGGNSGGEAGAPAPAPAALPQWVDAAIALVKVEGDEMAEVMPMEELVYLHNIIRAETAELKKAAGMLASSRGARERRDIAALIQRTRSLRSLLKCHCKSEDTIIFPALQAKGVNLLADTHLREHEHAAEMELVDRISHQLSQAQHFTTQTGAEEVWSDMYAAILELVQAVEQHLDAEERTMLPILNKTFTRAEQRSLMWRSLRQLPLVVLEHVFQSVGASLSDKRAALMLDNMRLAAPEVDAQVLGIMVRWALEGRSKLRAHEREGDSSKDHEQQHEHQQQQPSAPSPQAASLEGPERHATVAQVDEPLVAPSAAPPVYDRDAKRPRVDAEEDARASSSIAPPATATTSTTTPAAQVPRALTQLGGKKVSPIDHIFTVHRAISAELEWLDAHSTALEERTGRDGDEALRDFCGRFRFLWGMYRAHSDAEDNIVFPALEAKEVTHNVSHSYVLDHQQEEELLKEIAQALDALRELTAGGQPVSADVGRRRELCGTVRNKCKVLKISLEQHVKGEEGQLWPMFVAHFSLAEQEELVGRIIGQTGAEVLKVMLEWMETVNTAEEQASTLQSLRQASRNTMFSKWLQSSMGPNAGTSASVGQAVEQGRRDQKQAGTRVRGQTVMAKDAFKPGWMDLFRLNQADLQVAAAGVLKQEGSSASAGEQASGAEMQAYVANNLLVSNWILDQSSRDASDDGRATATVSPRRNQSVMDAQPVHHDRQPSGGGVQHGCKHYKRNCLLVARCCGEAFHCRFCHDEKQTDHVMNRFDTEEMICIPCGTRQPVSNECRSCHSRMAQYYCNICKLFDSSGRDIYHCPFCNICRIGKGLGKDVRHCMRCNTCVSVELFDSHRCREKHMEVDCPVCHESCFTSATPVHELPCGHFLHSACFEAYSQYSYRCPVCAKSMGDMRGYFKMLDALLESEKLRENEQEAATGTEVKQQDIFCNDCEKNSQTPFHWVYHKCTHCSSYNTRLA